MLEHLYQNPTGHMVILRCVGAEKFYLEKVIMPTEVFCFEAPPETRLEIWQMSKVGQMLHLSVDAKEYKITTNDELSIAS